LQGVSPAIGRCDTVHSLDSEYVPVNVFRLSITALLPIHKQGGRVGSGGRAIKC
jgi:hypothetical protein